MYVQTRAVSLGQAQFGHSTEDDNAIHAPPANLPA